MIIELWNKYRHHQAAKFVFVGILNTIVGYAAFGLFIYLGVHYAPALALATIIGTLHSYLWNKYFTFKKLERSVMEFARFIGVYAVIYGLNLLILWIFVDKLNMNPLLAQGGALVLVTICSYLGHKFWSFK